jgi:hypothetical protein
MDRLVEDRAQPAVQRTKPFILPGCIWFSKLPWLLVGRLEIYSQRNHRPRVKDWTR